MRTPWTTLFSLVVLLGTACSGGRAEENWPQFRGPEARGISGGTNLPERWSAKENVAWQCDIPGRGWSSPIVWKDRIFLTTVINTGKSEDPKKGLYFGGDRLKPPDTVHQWQVFCLDLKSGKVVWKRQVHEGKPQSTIHIKSSYASETPVTDGERVYCYFGNLGMFCFDLEGKELWKHPLQPQKTRLGWGTAASPVLHKERLYLVNDNEQESYLLALDAKTGSEVWRTPREEKSNWSTPFIWQNKLRTEIVTLGSGQVRSYDLDGKLLWWLKGMSSITIATPYASNGLLYFSSGYILDSSRPIYAVRPGAKGDISLREGKSANDFIAWSLPKAGPYNPTTLLVKDRLYVLYDRGFFGCFNAKDGKTIYESQRLPKGIAFTASPWSYNDKVFCLNEDGVTFVLQAGDEFKVLRTNTLADDDMCMATPAIAGDRLLIRTAARVYCLQNTSPKEETRKEIEPADWSTYNHDLAGWRYNAAEKALSPTTVGKLVEKWRFPAADSKETIGVVHATPTVVGGEVYFGTATFPAFYKLAQDGTLLWVYRNPARKEVLPPQVGAAITGKLRSAASEAGIFGSALVADGAVYFADTGGWMYCLDSQTGKERWKVDSRAPAFPDAHLNNLLMASPILADGKVVFAGGTLEQLFAGTFLYTGSTGRGFVVALEPKTGKLIWKYNVGPKPEKLATPVVVEGDWGKSTFSNGPATSSVWCTPSYDAETNTLYFGTDVNTAPRKPTKDNPSLATEDSCSICAIDAATGKRKWNTQINPGDMWTNAMRAYDPKTGLYKDASIGDTPKVLILEVEGNKVKVVGAGCKNGGFYLLRADNGKILKHTPIYTGPPTHPPAKHDPRVLALPSPIGGLQTGCATDGRTVFTNGIDAVRLGTQASMSAEGQVPTGGRVTATSLDLTTERWRHERPKIAAMGGTPEKPLYRDVGDVVASGIALGNGVAYFTTVASGKLIALDAATGKVLKEFDLGPVFAGPSLSRGRVYVGSGNTLFTPSDGECFFPKKYTGTIRCFGLPGEDEVDKLPRSKTN